MFIIQKELLHGGANTIRHIPPAFIYQENATKPFFVLFEAVWTWHRLLLIHLIIY